MQQKNTRSEKAIPRKCAHFCQTYHFTNQILNRPKATTLSAVPETCQLHAICNTGNPHEVNMRRIVYCCRPCIQQDGQCENIDICDEWKAFNMQTNKYVPPNFTLWAIQPSICNIPQIPKTWDERLNEMSFINFVLLEQYIATNQLPEIEALSIDDAMLESDKNHLDYVTLHHLPPDGPDGYAPVKIFGDGNCFPHMCSYLVSKHQERYPEFRV